MNSAANPFDDRMNFVGNFAFDDADALNVQVSLDMLISFLSRVLPIVGKQGINFRQKLFWNILPLNNTKGFSLTFTDNKQINK